MPRFRPPLTVLAGVVLAVAAVGTGAAYAASNAPAKGVPANSAPLQAPPPASAATDPSPTADGDTVQQGGQTTPDVADAAPESGSEAPESATETGTETGTETEADDGPGGHADPPGTVDHQFEGAE
jgi:hypothetical protein